MWEKINTSLIVWKFLWLYTSMRRWAKVDHFAIRRLSTTFNHFSPNCFVSSLTLLWIALVSQQTLLLRHMCLCVLNLSLPFLFLKIDPSITSFLLHIASVFLHCSLLTCVQTSSRGLKWVGSLSFHAIVLSPSILWSDPG